MNTYCVLFCLWHLLLATLLYLYFLPAARRQRAARAKRFDEWLQHEVFPSVQHDTAEQQPAIPVPPKPLLSPKAKKILKTIGVTIGYCIGGIILVLFAMLLRQTFDRRTYNK